SPPTRCLCATRCAAPARALPRGAPSRNLATRFQQQVGPIGSGECPKLEVSLRFYVVHVFSDLYDDAAHQKVMTWSEFLANEFLDNFRAAGKLFNLIFRKLSLGEFVPATFV